MAESLQSSLRSGRGLRAYAAVVLGFMVLVILEGAVVRATGSGAGCGNHWPLCNGEILPHHPRLATIIEFTHRSLTGCCTTLFVALFTWVFLARAKGDPARRAVRWSAVLLLTEALLGAVLVKGGYVEHNTSDARVFVQSVHFTNTMLLVALLALTWWTLRPRSAVRSVPRSPRGLVWLALIATMIVGATGSVAALADTLFPSPSLHAAFVDDLSAHAPLLVRMRVLHPAAAVISLLCVAWLCFRIRARSSSTIALLLAFQLVLGAADVLLLAPTWLQVLHLLGADLFWIALVVVSADQLAAPAVVAAGARELALTT